LIDTVGFEVVFFVVDQATATFVYSLFVNTTTSSSIKKVNKVIHLLCIYFNRSFSFHYVIS